MNWNEKDGVPWLEADLAGRARVVFSTRDGGGSEGPFRSLNLGILTDDDRGNVLENRLTLSAAVGFDPERVS
ncbi:MAG TPA: laccase domain-containing protein, partial [Solirubrobacterales bacterium]|nr:laccase domain-containing protein [Solirubrobacterales bacterium]